MPTTPFRALAAAALLGLAAAAGAQVSPALNANAFPPGTGGAGMMLPPTGLNANATFVGNSNFAANASSTFVGSTAIAANASSTANASVVLNSNGAVSANANAARATANANAASPVIFPWMTNGWGQNPITIIAPDGQRVTGFFDPPPRTFRLQTPASFSDGNLIVPGNPNPSGLPGPLAPTPISPQGTTTLPANSGSATTGGGISP